MQYTACGDYFPFKVFVKSVSFDDHHFRRFGTGLAYQILRFKASHLMAESGGAAFLISGMRRGITKICSGEECRNEEANFGL